jgi:hypothetical protein
MRFTLILCAAAGVLCTSASGLAHAADADARVGVFAAVEGTVSVLRAGKLPSEDVKVGAPVYEGDAVRTKRLSKAEISMKDGSVLNIAESTRIDISLYKTDEAVSKSVITLPRGSVRAVVSKRVTSRIEAAPDVNHFEIHTPNAVTGVRGTDENVGFNVPRQETTTIVHEGRVEFYNKANPLVKQVLTENQISNAVGNNPPSRPRTMTESEKKSSKESTETKKKEDKKDDKDKEDKGKDDKVKDDKGKDDKGGDKKGDGDKDKGDADKGEGDKGAATKGDADKKSGKDAGDGMKAGETSFMEPDTTMAGGPIASLPPVMNLAGATMPTFGTLGAFNIFTLPFTAMDNIPPDLLITSMPKPITNLSLASFSFSANESVTYYYSLDGGGWIQIAGSTLYLSGLPQGQHRIDIKAVDMAGNSTIKFYSWITDYLAPIITLTGPDRAVTSKNAAFILSSNKTVTYSFTLDGILVSSQNFSGLSEGTHIFEVKATDLAGNVVTKTHTWFVGDIARGFDADGMELHSYNNTGYDIKMSDLGKGITTLWSSSQSSPAKLFYYGSFSSLNSNPHVMFGGGFSGFSSLTASGGAVSLIHIGTEVGGAFNMKVYGIYMDPSGNVGFVIGDGAGGASTLNGPGTVIINGSVYVIQVGSRPITPSVFSSGIVSGVAMSGTAANFKLNSLASGNYSYLERHTTFRDTLGSSSIGVWYSSVYGSYSGISVSDSWSAAVDYVDSNNVVGFEWTGSKWSGGTITGKVLGYRATATDPAGNAVNKTGITVGDVMGTFNPGNSTFQMVSGGIYLETAKLLNMASTSAGRATLQQLGIPAFEVGRTTLTGGPSGTVSSITLSNVIFLSPTAGGKPQIWATGNLSGVYGGNPVGVSVALTDGSGILNTVFFETTYWANSQWLAKINGSGSISGGGWNGSVNMKGAGAGTYGGGSFSGTASGTVK